MKICWIKLQLAVHSVRAGSSDLCLCLSRSYCCEVRNGGDRRE